MENIVSKRTIALIVKTRHAGTVHGLPEDISEYSLEEIGELLEALGEVVKQPKSMTYLSVKTKHGATIIHPEDISYMDIHSDDEEIIKLIQEVI